MIQKLLLFWVIICPFIAYSQELSVFPINFLKDGIPYKNALAGGLDLPQFSAADLNNDGIEDLYIFDKLGNVSLGFINEGVPNEIDYTFDWTLTENFPVLSDWVMLRDYNQDGAMDIFAFSDVLGLDGIVVYQGFWNDDKLDFEKVNFPNLTLNLLHYSTTSPQRILPSNLDIPAIDDLDEDGDLDILAFSPTLGYVEFYKNQSVEMGFGLDTLVFLREKICWGDFLQDTYSDALILSENIGECALGSPNLNAIHSSAASFFTLDMDGDSDKDLIFGNLENSQIFTFTNTGSSSAEAHISDINLTFPTTSFPDIAQFIQVPFFLDLNNDEKVDAVISNYIFGRESYDIGWFFANMGENNNPVFELQQTDFLIEDMLDFGSGAHPVFVDYNADGLLDLVVANAQKWDETGVRRGGLYLFENIGSPTEPEFSLINEDWLGLAADSISHSNLAPDFGDLDGDGDLDLLVGESSGALNFFENTAGVGNPMEFVFQEVNFLGLNTITGVFFGTQASPQIVDVNKDGLFDLVIGERNGNLNYFQNQGTATNPVFDPDPTNPPNNESWGSIDFNIPGFSSGNTSPFLLEVADSFWLIVGSEVTGIREFRNISANLEGIFTEVNGEFSETIRTGHLLNPALADLNGDGFLEIAIGNARGGLQFFQTSIHPDGTVAAEELKKVPPIDIAPNPFEAFLQVFSEKELSEIELIDCQGVRLNVSTERSKNITFSTENLPSGVYFLRGITEGENWVEKVVKH